MNLYKFVDINVGLEESFSVRVNSEKLDSEIDKSDLKTFLNEHLQLHMAPKRLKVDTVSIGYRFKKM